MGSISHNPSRAANSIESGDVPADKARLVAQMFRPVIDHRVNKTKWVVLRWPTAAMAQQAKMSTEAFEDFYFRVCTQDYARMVPGMAALKERMERTDPSVSLTGLRCLKAVWGEEYRMKVVAHVL